MPQSLFEHSGLSQGNSAALYEIWAPANSRWSPWVAPALFAQMECRDAAQISEPVAANEWHETRASRDTALIIDLPGAECVQFALALAQIGYRPVLLINSSPGPIGPMPPMAPERSCQSPAGAAEFTGGNRSGGHARARRGSLRPQQIHARTGAPR